MSFHQLDEGINYKRFVQEGSLMYEVVRYGVQPIKVRHKPISGMQTGNSMGKIIYLPGKKMHYSGPKPYLV